ncbi:ribonuclease domain-containing protein [Sinomonas sp. ASV322]|uniref:ribonuclease domain-containing protein n=1 Tax=Sinomonas sp. ASV322 TaxID=3041920 RepID=UPI0027DC3FCF|nr:ribonuclease domain-containing protein [Sinomonas sp. ASV322]MDQ4503834.1 ribonuclease domain-containing protein [Sinomonas sp. ASV322]
MGLIAVVAVAVVGLLFFRPGAAPTGAAIAPSAASQSKGQPSGAAHANPSALPEIKASQLPREAQETLALIAKGGPYPYSRDGINFGNFEGRLPKESSGYYSEYTVATPGEADRGARRIIVGKATEKYYTDDHYNSFKFIVEGS